MLENMVPLKACAVILRIPTHLVEVVVYDSVAYQFGFCCPPPSLC